MFGLENLTGWHLLALALIGMFVFGPDRLPKAIADGVRMLRQLRSMARNATSDLSRELGTEITLEDLNPKALLRKHLLSEEDEQALRKPLEDIYQDVKKDLTGIRAEARDVASGLKAAGRVTPATASNTASTSTPVEAAASATPTRRVIDDDAT
jgi:sec-independent protein translocase protein TatB